MKPLFTLTLLSFLLSSASAQIDLECDSRDKHSIYGVSFDGFSKRRMILRIDSVDTNPTATRIVFDDSIDIQGISINANLNDGSGDMAFYSTQAPASNYFYWDGSTWINTGHSGMNGNPGGGTKYIYNLDAVGGKIYRYDGTANATQLMQNLQTKNNAMYDVAVDKANNFYILYPPYNRIIMFTEDGILIDTLTTSGDASTPAGPGFAILGTRMYYIDQDNFLFEGILTGSNVHFTKIKQFPLPYFADIAACPGAAEVLAVFRNPEAPHFALYPNPSDFMVHISLRNTTQIDVIDCLGRIVLTTPIQNSNQHEFSVSDWPAGLYFVKASAANGASAVSRLMVK